MNEFIQVKTRVCDTYCSHHHHFSSLIAVALKKREKSKYVLHAIEIYLIYIL